VEFDRPYDGVVLTVVTDNGQRGKLCPRVLNNVALACTFRLTTGCLIVIAPDPNLLGPPASPQGLPGSSTRALRPLRLRRHL
jgi:hypothetical protein